MYQIVCIYINMYVYLKMKYSKFFTMTTAVVFLLMLLLTTETVAEGNKVCKYKSKKFWGLCFNDIRCTDVCKHEGFEGGDCEGFRRRCYCYNHCRSSTAS
ncbi:hypothetical protein ACP275_05G047100 [Erythranthe tilingii]